MKIIKISLVLLFTLLPSFLLSSCWDSIDIEDLALVKGVGLDRGTDPGRVRVTVQLLTADVAAEQNGDEGKGFHTISTTGYSVHGAITNLKRETGRPIFLGLNDIVIIGEELAEQDGVRDHLDFFVRHPKLDLRTNVMVASGEAREVLDTEHPLEDLPTRLIETHFVIDAS